MPNDNQGQSSEGQQQVAEPKYMTAEEVGNVVNQAITSHLKRINLSEQIQTALKPFQDQMAKLTTQPVQADDEGGKKGKQSPEVADMARKLEEITKSLAVEREQRVALDKKSKDDKAFFELRSALEGKVRPELVDMLAKSMHQIDRRVEVDENGQTFFKVSKAPYPGGEPEEQLLPLQSGVEEFLKSESAKPFLPSPSTANTSPLPKKGPTPSRPRGDRDFSQPATSEADKARRSIERERMAKETLRNE